MSEKAQQMHTIYADQKRKMVRKLLFMGYQMGYDKPQNSLEMLMEKHVVNKLHVNRWLLSEHSAVRKEMDNMTHAELRKALTQFTLVFNDFKKRV